MKQWILKNNLSSGELSPLLWTRTDIQQYANGSKKLFNALPLVEGGAKKRPGTKFKSIFAGALRLIPFIANSENTYLLIIGVSSLKVYNPRTYEVVYDVATPYDTEKKVRELQYAHTKYRMYLVQGDTPVHRLLCSADFTNWQFSQFIFGVNPNDELGTTPNVALTPSGTDVGKIISLTAASFPNWVSTETYLTGDRVIRASKTWLATIDNKDKEPNGTNPEWDEVTNEAANVFTASSVGAIVEINGGQVKITEYIKPAVVNGEVLVKLTTTVQAIAKSWVLKSIAFSATAGYPKAVCFFKQRLVFANTKTSPNQMWFSRIGDDGNFLETTEDADAFSIASSSAQSDNILHLAQRGGVVALTGGAEFLINSQGPLTPATAQIDEHTSYGVQANVKPCRVGNELLFVQRGGERLRAMSYRYEVDGLVSPELSAIAPHISENHGGVKEITYQQTPSSIVWIVMSDGSVASITLNRDQEMNAWAQHDFGCSVLSICALPTGLGEDQCFMLTQRNGYTVLEEFSETALSDCEFDIDVIDGVGSILNLDIQVLSSPMVSYNNQDGYFYSDYTIVGTDINLPVSDLSQTVYLGQPYLTEIDLLPPDFSEAPSSAMFHKIQVHEMAIFLNGSVGGFINGQELSTKYYNQSAFLNLPYTGYVVDSFVGWQALHELEVKITHNKPLPFHMQSITMLVSINEK
ncbi:phage nozzle protein [Acinetobacter haemolyticus]|uniref:Carbohydrate-binding protein n=1 Tax=Acinetobacter haemolyticus TaxID=29430 RepID=A0A4P7B211_ACIHA|nr:carbohydrate-binding protein [Acinetobacter haemolyticus]QBQ15607.1 carbohydrate-binding protein [Acinetobacter haemolyticus]